METRTIIILIILLIIGILIYNNIQKSSSVVSISTNIPVEEEIKKKENKSNIWKVGDTLKLGDSIESENGLYKIKVESGKKNGINMLYLISFNPKLAKPIIITSNFEGATFTLFNDGIHSHSTTDVTVSGIKANTRYDKDKNETIIMASLSNKDDNTYNSYDINGNFLGAIEASQNYQTVKNIDHIIFDNSGVFGVDNFNNIIFVDLF